MLMPYFLYLLNQICTWSQISAMRASRLGERDGDVLKQVVSSSIELFFEERDGDERRAQSLIPEDQRE